MADCARGVITSCWTLLPRVPSPALVKITWPDGVDPTVASAWKPAVTSTPPVTTASPMTDKAGSRSGTPVQFLMATLAPVAKGSEERRGGEEWVGKCRTGWGTYH